MAYDATYTDMDVLAFHFHDTSVGSRAENFTPETPQVALLFEKSMQLWQVGTPSSRMEATAQFYTILSLLAVPVSSSYKESALAKAVAFLNERYADPDLCIPALCEHAAISESALRRHFCERYGKSPIKYLNELRLSEAQKRLVSTRDTVERIALDCGFRDVKYFSRAFKRYFGCTPSTLRAL